ncbi:UBX domain-containing protein 4 isoform X2 [Labrus mixtus]|uniref:UBX domain-containing protein 4 isoform X1 n=1 Tax=Labrus mixtus TaxID=508554 RepID=UPI0029C0288D|nr:UBX domain-containing protein 4 isoform X1 [Labrus mixtus]XP_060890413.1 UBX domain-containing protein 4 isoform X2 [Labrus mixtus]
MLWFQGSIPDAISSAKQRGSVFVVVITGDDEQSSQLMSSWEDDIVSETANSCCVAIRVDGKSDTCVQFSQIYPVVCIPSSFFIGDNGIPLEVIAGSVSAEELINRIHRVKQMHAQQIGPDTMPPAENSPHDNRASHPAPEPAPDSDPGPSGGVTSAAETTKVSPADQTSSQHQSDENLEAKVERLTKKLEERREQKKVGEDENEIRKEMERRKTGKDVQDFKKKQEDEKTKRLLEERNREKAEERAARERVKQQIAMDRADRAARYAKVQEEDQAAKLAAQQVRQAEQEARREVLLRERSTVARIQFRLPDGSSFTNQFPSQSRLQEARNFAVQEVGNRYGNFSLATMFPRREFTNEDLERTLLELELAPSASIVLLPQSSRPSNTVAQSSGGSIWAVLGTLLYPLLAVWRFLSSFLFTAPPPPGTSSRDPVQHQSNSYTNSTAASDKTKRETLSKHSVEKRPRDFKKDGKVCRLRTQEDSEDDNNTWNGNSTQQM